MRRSRKKKCFFNIHKIICGCLCVCLYVCPLFPSTSYGPIWSPKIHMDFLWHGGCFKNIGKALGQIKDSWNDFITNFFVIPNKCPYKYLSFWTLVIPNLCHSKYVLFQILTLPLPCLCLASASCIKCWSKNWQCATSWAEWGLWFCFVNAAKQQLKFLTFNEDQNPFKWGITQFTTDS